VAPPGYVHGTHRAVPPSATLRRIQPLLAAAGITRLADLTGLDWVGIPVYQAVRPDSHLLSTSQGKGLTRDQARVSALMEALEGFHAEHVDQPTARETVGHMRRSLSYDPCCLLLSRRSQLNDASLIDWVEATDLSTGAPTWVPKELCELDFRVRERLHRPLFRPSTSGLASGNTVVEAIIHGLCELIERDGCRRYVEERLDPARFVDPSTIQPRLARGLLDRLDAAGMTVDIIDASGPIGVPSFEVWLGHSDGPLRVRGSGAHPSRLTALVRAITEAAQARLTFIAGSRDDIRRHAYEPNSPARSAAMQPFAPHRRYASAPTLRRIGFLEMMHHLVTRIRDATGTAPLAVDLRRAEFNLPVVFVLAPGLLSPDHA
jgi:ribosomal protein S12 methylthiotransferase accessory factor